MVAVHLKIVTAIIISKERPHTIITNIFSSAINFEISSENYSLPTPSGWPNDVLKMSTMYKGHSYLGWWLDTTSVFEKSSYSDSGTELLL